MIARCSRAHMSWKDTVAVDGKAGLGRCFHTDLSQSQLHLPGAEPPNPRWIGLGHAQQTQGTDGCPNLSSAKGIIGISKALMQHLRSRWQFYILQGCGFAICCQDILSTLEAGRGGRCRLFNLREWTHDWTFAKRLHILFDNFDIFSTKISRDARSQFARIQLAARRSQIWCHSHVQDVWCRMPSCFVSKLFPTVSRCFKMFQVSTDWYLLSSSVSHLVPFNFGGPENPRPIGRLERNSTGPPLSFPHIPTPSKLLYLVASIKCI